MSNTLFPIFLKTERLRFLLVGGGNVGIEKIRTLLKQNPTAHIKLIATEIFPEMYEILAAYPHIEYAERAFEPSDLDDVELVISATNDSKINAHIKSLANERKLLGNAADQPNLCDFYLGSIIQKGNLKIAISTNGKSPILARRMREYFEEALPETIDETILELHDYRNTLKGDFQNKLFQLSKITKSLNAIPAQSEIEPNNPKIETVEPIETLEITPQSKKYIRLTWVISIAFLTFFIGYGLSVFVSANELQTFVFQIPTEFFEMIAIGFLAQLVNGSIGMGYCVVCATAMMWGGIALPAISSSVNMSGVFSNAISGYSHYRFGNVNKKMLYWLVGFGMIGAVSGALLLIYLGDKYNQLAYLLLAIYTLFVGLRLLVVSFRSDSITKKSKHLGLLGIVGGFAAAFSGSGWGPIVTSSLMSKRKGVSYVVGTSSLAKFFINFISSTVLFFSIGVSHWYVIAGLILGGVVAAPLGSRLTKKIPRKPMMILVALLVILSSVKILMKYV
ncbi:TSUP family transporter [Bernardetia sp. MNP-M8]|uniref:TSUP family transporter n=1 Tax=Bernardetia sp. MNP-M8 TaxID=3127470 RepID=UPI0030CD439D